MGDDLGGVCMVRREHRPIKELSLASTHYFETLGCSRFDIAGRDIGGWERLDLKLPEVGLPDDSLVSVENPTTVLLNPRQHYNNPRQAFGKTAECTVASS